MRIRDVKKKIVVSKESLIYKDFFSAMYNEGYAVVIQPPSRRVVRISSSGEIYSQWGYDYDYDRHDFSGNFFLSFPHVVFGIRYYNGTRPGDKKKKFNPRHLRVAFATSNNPQNLYVPPLFNIGDDLGVCVAMPKGNYPTVEKMAKATIATFWATEFNDGMFDALTANYDESRILTNPKTWEKKTRNNPRWIPTARAFTEGESFRDFCRVGESLIHHESDSSDYDDD